jgi:hypothetical protein
MDYPERGLLIGARLGVHIVIRELDTVVLACDIKFYGLKRGDIGAVVHCYEGNIAFEVEFVTDEGETVAVLTLMREDIRPMGRKEIPRVLKIVTS